MKWTEDEDEDGSSAKNLRRTKIFEASLQHWSHYGPSVHDAPMWYWEFAREIYTAGKNKRYHHIISEHFDFMKQSNRHVPLLSPGTYEAVSCDEEHNGPHVRLQMTQRQTD